MNWFKKAILEDDWYKTWIYYLSNLIKRSPMFEYYPQGRPQWLKENFGQNILFRDKNPNIFILREEYDPENNPNAMFLSLAYLGYLFDTVLISNGEVLNIDITFYHGVEVESGEKIEPIKFVLSEINPEDILYQLEERIVAEGDKKYQEETTAALGLKEEYQEDDGGGTEDQGQI